MTPLEPYKDPKRLTQWLPAAVLSLAVVRMIVHRQPSPEAITQAEVF